MPDHDIQDEGRSRAFWSGLLSFGLVSIPVELLPAHRSGSSPLRMLDADGTPLARRYYCPADEKEVDAEQLVRGYQLDNGKVVVVSDEELEALEPKKSREIDLRLFVDRDSIDPLYFERSYFLAPGADSGKAYRLLGSVMERSRRAGIATFVMRDREYLVAIFAEAGLLRAETLRFAGEVRSSADIGLPKPIEPEAKRMKQLRQAVEGLETKRWSSAGLTDTHAAIRKLAETKHRRKQDVVAAGETPAEAGAQIIDLMEVLRKSLADNGLAANGSKAGTTRAAPKHRPASRQRSARTAKPKARASRSATKRSKTAARKPRARRG